MGLGCCGIGAFEQEQCDQLFDLDGQEEFVVYTTPVGTLRESDKDAEQAFYRFVQEEGL
jgi:nitroreductase